jgi:GTP-binding protein YchF
LLKCGIIGLPLCGKSTLLNVITRAGAEVKPYASGKTDANRAIVSVPDIRFNRLAEVFEPKKKTPASVEFVDIAGLSRDASKGAGLGNSFLSHVSEADALLHVIRMFGNPDVIHPEDSIDPVRDWQIVEMELIYRDLGVIENKLSRLAAKKKNSPEEIAEVSELKRLQEFLMEERPLRELNLTEDEKRAIYGYTFLTLKPELIVLNLDESQASFSEQDEVCVKKLRDIASSRGLEIVKIYGNMEMEISELTPEEQIEFLRELGEKESGRERLIREAYKLLGLVSFFTCGKDEVKAWTLHKGCNALSAAGTIHSDLARGFIRAQVVHYDDFAANGYSISNCRSKGVLRLEGKEYVVKDGDMIEIRFNV